MFYPPTTPLLPLHDPPVNGPGHDVPPAASPRRSPLRSLAARMTRTRVQPQPAALTPDGDQISVPP